MGTTRTDLFSEEQNKIASIAKVLGHPARIAIFQFLLRQQACICGDIVTEIGLSQPTISQHLREMKDIGLIKGNISGTKVCYCIDQKTYKNIKNIFDNLFNHKFSNTKC